SFLGNITSSFRFKENKIKMLRSKIPILISLDHIRPKDPRLSLGVASIVSHLKQKKIEYNAHTYNIAEETQVYSLARNILDTIWRQYNDSKYDLMFGWFCLERAFSQDNP
ncbi:hypothetical protein ACROYT_G031960, partial [Oculina patagonica]